MGHCGNKFARMECHVSPCASVKSRSRKASLSSIILYCCRAPIANAQDLISKWWLCFCASGGATISFLISDWLLLITVHYRVLLQGYSLRIIKIRSYSLYTYTRWSYCPKSQQGVAGLNCSRILASPRANAQDQ